MQAQPPWVLVHPGSHSSLIGNQVLILTFTLTFWESMFTIYLISRSFQESPCLFPRVLQFWDLMITFPNSMHTQSVSLSCFLDSILCVEPSWSLPLFNEPLGRHLLYSTVHFSYVYNCLQKVYKVSRLMLTAVPKCSHLIIMTALGRLVLLLFMP